MIVIGEYLAARIDKESYGYLIKESLVIGGWVALWRPLEIFLYDWWPIRAEARLLDRLARWTCACSAHAAAHGAGSMNAHRSAASVAARTAVARRCFCALAGADAERQAGATSPSACSPASAATWVSLRLLPPASGRLRFGALLALLPHFLWESVLAGVDVARRALRAAPAAAARLRQLPAGLPAAASRATPSRRSPA